MKAVYDTNVYVSALFWEGPPRRLLLEAVNGAVELVISDFILDEVARVLKDHLSVSDDKAEEVRSAILSISTKVHPKERLNVVRDRQDNRVLECALEGGCGYVVTGDNDLLALKEYRGVRILSPRDFLSVLEGGN